MSTRIIRIILVCLIATFSACKNTSVKKKIEPNKPNIVFIYADDWGYEDLGKHGSTFCKTPNLDKMIDEGMDFQNFSVNNPVCSPSRTGLITGQYPARHSVHGHFANVESNKKRNMPDWLNPTEVMLPRLLKEAGYQTAHYGKWHLSNTHVADGPSPKDYGYDQYDAFNLPSRLKQMSTDSTMTRTLEFIEKSKDNPFFVNVWIHAAHTPHYPKEKFLSQFSDLDEQQKVYASIIAEADYNIGLLFAKLKELGIDENTLVVFSSDNGPEITGTVNDKKLNDNSTGPGYGRYYSVGETKELKGRKRSLFAGGVRVPFIVRWPGVVPPNKIDTSTPITAIDMLPTFVDVSGAILPDGYRPDGENIIAAFKGENFKRQSPIFWQWNFAGRNSAFWPSLAIQDGDWKFLMNKKNNRRELYNTKTDWAEQNDVSDVNPEKVIELENKLNQWVLTLPKNAPETCFSVERNKTNK